jgi:hypothetical protein
LRAQTTLADSELVAHEWGTFTSISGIGGEAVEWLPLTGSTDLPGFVEHLGNSSAKGGLRGTVRMETPVLYFYSPRPQTVSVRVRFRKGLITEWYPHGRVSPGVANQLPLRDFEAGGGVSWSSVSLDPAEGTDFAREDRENHYYAARETGATPLRVMTTHGTQHERFLFYRGVAAFPPPVGATVVGGGKLRLVNLDEDPISRLVLFERRGERVGYRVIGPLRGGTVVAPAELNQSDVRLLTDELEQILITSGLYQDEAHAMIETWKDSWFEEGCRLFYIVPSGFVDRVLPLSVKPTPAQVARVFVGRIELVTPSTERAVEEGFVTQDTAILKKYARFLEPILTVMMSKESDPARVARLQGYLNRAAGVAWSLR